MCVFQLLTLFVIRLLFISSQEEGEQIEIDKRGRLFNARRHLIFGGRGYVTVSHSRAPNA